MFYLCSADVSAETLVKLFESKEVLLKELETLEFHKSYLYNVTTDEWVPFSNNSDDFSKATGFACREVAEAVEVFAQRLFGSHSIIRLIDLRPN